MKRCTRCNEIKPLSDFLRYPYKTNQGKNSFRLESRCNPCVSIRRRERANRWLDQNPEKRKETQRRFRLTDKGKTVRLRHMYGITWEFYKAEYAKQEGKCLICGRFKERLHIDHDHKTKKYRGLLCDPCNQAIGKFYDNPELCRRAAEYLCQKL